MENKNTESDRSEIIQLILLVLVFLVLPAWLTWCFYHYDNSIQSGKTTIQKQIDDDDDDNDWQRSPANLANPNNILSPML